MGVFKKAHGGVLRDLYLHGSAIDEEKVKNLITEYTQGDSWGLFGEARLNVLRLNLALDKLSSSQGGPP